MWLPEETISENQFLQSFSLLNGVAYFMKKYSIYFVFRIEKINKQNMSMVYLKFMSQLSATTEIFIVDVEIIVLYKYLLIANPRNSLKFIVLLGLLHSYFSVEFFLNVS